jgi:hypothetical protein
VRGRRTTARRAGWCELWTRRLVLFRIAIGLSKARRAGVNLSPPRMGRTKASTRKSAEYAYSAGQHKCKPTIVRAFRAPYHWFSSASLEILPRVKRFRAMPSRRPRTEQQRTAQQLPAKQPKPKVARAAL